MLLGKSPYIDHPRNAAPLFREALGQFAEGGALPSLPAALSWKGTIETDSWKSLGNSGDNAVGDCTVAAACHMMMCWSDNALGAPWDFETEDVVADFNDYKTSKDSAAMQNILWAWKTYGIHRRDAGNPVPVQIEDYALLDINNQARLKLQVQRSIQLLGGCYIGIVLPKFAVHYIPGNETPQGNTPVWSVTSAQLTAMGANAAKDPKAGHCVCAVGYEEGGIEVVTWGEWTLMSWDFFNAYMDEAWAVMCQSAWLKADGTTPSGLTKTQLGSDFNGITANGG